MLDKYAVRCGGGQNHRLDLSDGVLIKNNHIALAGGIVPALERAHKNRRGAQIIEIEVRSLEELEQALEHGGEAILLDNMSVEDVKRAVERCSRVERRIPLEVSGGITLENVRAYAETGVNFISVGRAHPLGEGDGYEPARGPGLGPQSDLCLNSGTLVPVRSDRFFSPSERFCRLHFRVTLVASQAVEYSETGGPPP